MSVCIEQSNYSSNYQNNHNNFSQYLPAADKVLNLPRTRFSQKTLFIQVKLWMARSQQRKQLARLDEKMLKDIGITRVEVLAEVKKPFWK